MKFKFTLILLFTFILNIFSQSPEKMSYQAVIRSQNNTLIVSSTIGIKIILHQGTVTGTKVYQETHSVKTNGNGLVSLEIGTGLILEGSFSSIFWQNGPYFIETQIDFNGGSNYTASNITQLLSVPYALHSNTADRLISGVVVGPIGPIGPIGPKGDSVVGPIGPKGDSVVGPIGPKGDTGGFYRSTIMPVNASRNISISDISNTIECIISSTLIIPLNFNSMIIGDTINLEAHNGATLSIQGSTGVTVNYKLDSISQFISVIGNVRFGLLRKIGSNSYIISGQ